MPSISFYSNRRIKTVLVDLDLSIRVSVPTSNLPMDFGSMLYLDNRLWTTILMNMLQYLSRPLNLHLHNCRQMPYYSILNQLCIFLLIHYHGFLEYII